MLYLLKGDPCPLQRARIAGRRVYDNQVGIKLHARICLESQQDNVPPFENIPLHLNVTFFMKLPHNPKLRKQYLKQHYHIFKPDADNLLKMLGDISNSILYRDDCLIAKITAEKIYTDGEPRTEFTLTPLKWE